MAEIDAQQRHIGAADQFRGAQDRPISAEHHDQVDVGQFHFFIQDFSGSRPRSIRRLDVHQFGTRHYRDESGVVQLSACLLGRAHRILATGVRQDQNPPAHPHLPSVVCSFNVASQEATTASYFADSMSAGSVGADSGSVPILGSESTFGTFIHRKYSRFPS